MFPHNPPLCMEAFSLPVLVPPCKENSPQSLWFSIHSTKSVLLSSLVPVLTAIGSKLTMSAFYGKEKSKPMKQQHTQERISKSHWKATDNDYTPSIQKRRENPRSLDKKDVPDNGNHLLPTYRCKATHLSLLFPLEQLLSCLTSETPTNMWKYGGHCRLPTGTTFIGEETLRITERKKLGSEELGMNFWVTGMWTQLWDWKQIPWLTNSKNILTLSLEPSFQPWFWLEDLVSSKNNKDLVYPPLAL